MELKSQYTKYQLTQKLSDFLIYGMYPNILQYTDTNRKIGRLTEIVNSYMLADIFTFQKVKNAKSIIDLLRLLAFQVGSEVSTLELSNNLGLDHKTILRYLDLLEKSFVIFRLNGFSRNLRKEITKMSKYYFYDLGIRNTLIANYNNLNIRNDQGQLWENFLLMERIKYNAYKGIHANYYFWRTYDKKEIDFIEESAGQLCGYEFKWKNHNTKAPKDWVEFYPDADYKVITPQNYLDFIL